MRYIIASIGQKTILHTYFIYLATYVMKTILKIIIVIVVAYGLYRVIDKQWAQDLFDNLQAVFQSTDTIEEEKEQEDVNEEEQLPEITVPEYSSSSVSSENTLVLDYIFAWTGDADQQSTWSQVLEEEESETESEESKPNDTQDQTTQEEKEKTAQDNTPTPTKKWLTAEDYRDLERLGASLVE